MKKPTELTRAKNGSNVRTRNAKMRCSRKNCRLCGMEETMKRLLFGWLILAVSLTAQVEHAPTVAQCQADQRLWDFKFLHEREKLPDVTMLQKWNSELRDCLTVDPPTQLQYIFTVDEIDAETELRMLHFLQRHSMIADFKTEDAAGKR